MRQGSKWLAGFAGVGVAAGGAGLALVLWLLSRLPGGADVEAMPWQGPLALFALAALSLGLGLALAWTAFRSLQGIPSPQLALPPVWTLLLLFAVLLLAGQAVVGMNLARGVVLPPLHVVAMAVPALVVVAALGRALAARGVTVTRREGVLALCHGALLSIVGALALELLAAVAIGLAAALALAALPDGLASLRRMADLLAQGDANVLAEAARSPVVVLAVGSLLVVAAPLIEEAMKGAVAGLLGYRRPTAARAFLWGAIAGAGFAWVEGVFNSAAGEMWALTVVVRGSTAVMHAAGGGLAAVAWQSLVVRREAGRAALFYLAAVTLHGTWNATAGLLSLAGLQVQTRLGDTLAATAGGLAMLFLVGVLGVLWLASLAVLVVGARRLDGTARPAPAVLTAQTTA